MHLTPLDFETNRRERFYRALCIAVIVWGWGVVIAGLTGCLEPFFK